MILDSLQEFCKLLTPNKPIICVDYGLKKLGFAISDPAKKLAMPLEVKIFENEKSKLEYVEKLIIQYNISGIVVGLPLNMDGTSSEITQNVRKFGEELAKKIELPIFFQDERLSTKNAQSLLRSIGMNRKQRDKVDDQVSASIILETVINSMR